MVHNQNTHAKTSWQDEERAVSTNDFLQMVHALSRVAQSWLASSFLVMSIPLKLPAADKARRTTLDHTTRDANHENAWFMRLAFSV